MPAISFIEKINEIQTVATTYIEAKLKDYNVETRGVYIQDVVLPEELVQVLTQREIANQEIQTYKKKEELIVAEYKMKDAGLRFIKLNKDKY